MAACSLAFFVSVRKERPRFAFAVLILTLLALAGVAPLLWKGRAFVSGWPGYPLIFGWLLGLPGALLLFALSFFMRKADSGGRRRFLRSATGFAMAAARAAPFGGAVGMMTAQAWLPRTQIVEQEWHIQSLHPDLAGLRMVQISDLHLGPALSRLTIQQWVEMLQGIRADVLLVTGDVIDSANWSLTLFDILMNSVRGRFPLGMYAVAGNHDWYDDIEEWTQKVTSTGCTVLRDSHVMLSRGKGRLQVAGLEYPQDKRGEERMQAAAASFRSLEQRLDPQIPLVLLNHHPSDFSFLQNQGVDLILSGHTHGGQIEIAGWNVLRALPDRYPYYSGAYFSDSPRGRCKLYVNRGLGHSIPVRSGVSPEITIHVLR